jgi:hypothetical protein
MTIRFRYIITLLFLATGAGAAPEVRTNDTAATVIKMLGPPRGEISRGGQRILLYDRGPVLLENDRVVAVELISESDLVRRQAAERQRAEARQQAEDAERARRIEEGAAELRRTLADAAFTHTPVAEQAAYWDRFRQKYPEVDPGQPAEEAHERWIAQQQEERIREAESALAAAESEPEPKRSGSKKRRYHRIEANRDTSKMGAANP